MVNLLVLLLGVLSASGKPLKLATIPSGALEAGGKHDYYGDRLPSQQKSAKPVNKHQPWRAQHTNRLLQSYKAW